jgi:Xaa-Pro aminopeptidase
VDYKTWVKRHLKSLSESLGFRYIPKEEIDRRLTRIRKAMAGADMEAVLVVQKMDRYYFSGTTQDSYLFIPLHGIPMLMVKRELERAKLESPLDVTVPLHSVRELPSLISEHWGKMPETLGLEMDVIPVREYFRYEEIFPDTRLLDASGLIGETRKIKSPFEIEFMKKAGEIGRKTYEEGKRILKAGMTEIEFGGRLEAKAKEHAHEGLLRVRDINYEAYTWHVLSGSSGGIVSQSDSPMGGLGLSPAFPVGASMRVMGPYEPILVDFGTSYHGYLADETRMFSIGEMSSKFLDAYKACREIHDSILHQTRPGSDCETLYRNSVSLAEKLGYAENYLGPRGLQTRFVGHGIGLELAEYPYLAEGQNYALEEGMTFALEPKMVFPGEGSVGIENTVVVNQDGYELITTLEQDIIRA